MYARSSSDHSDDQTRLLTTMKTGDAAFYSDAVEGGTIIYDINGLASATGNAKILLDTAYGEQQQEGEKDGQNLLHLDLHLDLDLVAVAVVRLLEWEIPLVQAFKKRPVKLNERDLYYINSKMKE
ncbi:hypothetical protein FRACYDRAFT_246765 [Fragilariopsis cylindrus CCMP1102]|uniref:Uncharacterized protein n=1 Tax=Fragilariopsis cylindrus CCMP1102 TaxID=635003 RepID=A0A1E7EYH9_9STRA|nr:hypothetical protein FRACYDRAFT_246765 [Fragilariopsis cylindrus CCMP1102]|eukprot:OEU10889.1 hypothetical protein FRACYDRAFT_246765 [Fragilariopsis cylindrus CCMP1102]